MGIEKIVSELKKEKGVEAIYLFGSQATGNAKPYSDTDICVVTNRNAKKERILRNSSETIDTSIFWDLPIGVRYRVIRDGKVLFAKNKKNLHDITVKTVLSYLDFKPLLEKHSSLILS